MFDSTDSEHIIDPVMSMQLLERIQEYTDYLRGDLSGRNSLKPDEAAAFREIMMAYNIGVKLPPRIKLQPVMRQQYLASGLLKSTQISAQFKRCNYYYVEIPITLIPHGGLRIPTVEIRLAYNPGLPPDEQPLSYDLFPPRRWQDLITWQGGAELVLDEGIHFKMQPPGLGPILMRLGVMPEPVGGHTTEGSANPAADAANQLGVDAGFKVNAQLSGQSSVRLLPFNYLFRRPQVLSEGRGNNVAVWQFSGREELAGNEELAVAVVLEVPRTLHVLRIVPLVLVDYSWLRAQLSGLVELLRQSRDALSAFFGLEAEQYVVSFIDQIARGWRIKVGGDLVWDLSGDLL